MNLSCLSVEGDIRARALGNFERLHGKEYSIPNVYRSDSNGGTYDWPGDHEGRAILALALLSQALSINSQSLDEIVARLPEHFNEKGYLGRVLPYGIMDEQQVSGHSWLLRGLCEYYLWKKSQNVLDSIDNIARNLILPAEAAYTTYPIEPSQRVFSGEASGSLTGDIFGGWYCSSDIGCAFIMLDGATAAYEVLHNPALTRVIDNAIDRFASADLVGTQFQTHATLSALRGILRYYRLTGKAGLIDMVRDRFDLYESEGMTENYANYNWFCRPEWTEPCAIVDSFIVAEELWEATAEVRYLEDAHRIYFNGLGYAQVPNGGWGLDSCAGAKDEFIRKRTYEAWWCCTMRGGEGLARAIQYLFHNDADCVTLPFYADATARLEMSDGEVVIKETTKYPYSGEVRLDVVESSSKCEKMLRLFVLDSADTSGVSMTVNGKASEVDIHNDFVEIKLPLRSGTTIELKFGVELNTQPTVNNNSISGYHTYWHGPLMLGVKNVNEALFVPPDADMISIGPASYQVQNSDIVLSPINDLIYETDDKAAKDRRQVLFPDL